VVKLLCQEFGADPLLPVKFGDESYSNPNSAILTLVLALAIPVDKAVRMSETLLSLGATSSQADVKGITAFHRYVQVRNCSTESSFRKSRATNAKLRRRMALRNLLKVFGRMTNLASKQPSTMSL
jgi:hypothetical protein